ncbi:uncharacterized protein SOCE26_104480 [Sorangium cellulosum]|uniref:Uncharacterized protein n=1 Tax=Sorangium cellulosum TaxID=56 RepID=A0A2L0FBC7_SORCE|nr:hypothetical protein [Sorangium cellulosum]AUX48905.1 uncharacterized protein SOCE26_104480 [Sorangium cellulosum]
MARELKPEAVGQLSSLAVKRYLLARGWERVPSKRTGVGIFRRPDSAVDEVLLPLSSDFADLDDAMASAVEEIARLEQRPAQQVLRDLLRPRADRLRFAVEGRDTTDGAIGIEDGIALLSGSRKALLAAACSVKRPQRFHPRMSLREAEAFVRSCRLGQTEQGSFVATVECALDIDDGASPPLFEEAAVEPFGRKATVLLVRSAARVVDAIRADNLDDITEPPSGAPVVSANLCEALAEMLPGPEDADLRIGSSWSPVLPPPRDVPAVIRVDRQYRSAIEQVARALRPSTRPEPDMYVGKVDALLGEPGPDGRLEGEVVLAAQVEDEILKIRVDLGPEEYQKAGGAHLGGLFVSVRGILRRGARVHRLEEATDLSVLGAG